MPTNSPTPLLGFTRLGYLLSLVAAALLIVWLTGYDLRYQLLYFLDWALGTKAMMWFVSLFLTWHWLSVLFWQPHFSLIALMYTLIAMHIHPRRFGFLSYSCVVALALVTAPGQVQIGLWLSPTKLLPWWQLMVVAHGVMALLAVAIIGTITRSWRIALLLVLLGSISTAATYVTFMTPGAAGFSRAWVVAAENWPRVMYHTLLPTALMWWAIPTRKKTILLLDPMRCSRCGYSLEGLRDDQCPECGLAA